MNKSIVLLLAILAALLVIYLLVSEGEKRELTPEVIDNFLAIDSGAVNKVRVSKLGSEMNFEKRTDGWQMLEGEKTYKAEPSAVAEIEKLAYSLRVGEIVSSNPDKQMLFQVDTLMGTKVEFYRDDHFLGDIIIGKMGSNYQNCYVRKPGSEAVYNAVGPYSYLFNRPPSSFKDKTLLAFDRSLVNAIEFSGLGTDYTLLHQDTLWKVVPHQGESFVGDQSKIER
ncbi:MAG: DUF4340 domain-containing protein, partial [candidate division Zixibacteria bacterium]|nr:DUF4340 domain-containing protein [candidate division Zixibacteria bacterium]